MRRPKKRLLPPFKDRLTVAQAAQGIEFALKNARDLLGDAEFMLMNERWPRACALAVLAIEESGKPGILRALLLARSDQELHDEWTGYRHHTAKNVSWILPDLVSSGARQLEELRSLFDKSSDHPHLLDSIKQLALYSDCFGDCHWSLPYEAIDQSLAESIVSVAKVLVSNRPTAMTSAAELELWVKHIRPVWKGPMEDMKRALLACYQEAESIGVLRGDNTSSGMGAFLGFQ